MTKTLILQWQCDTGVKYSRQQRRRASLARLPKPGEPCGHPGCLSHVTHPCNCFPFSKRKKGFNVKDVAG